MPTPRERASSLMRVRCVRRLLRAGRGRSCYVLLALMFPQETYLVSWAADWWTLMALRVPVSWASVTPFTVVVEEPPVTLVSGYFGLGSSWAQVPAWMY